MPFFPPQQLHGKGLRHRFRNCRSVPVEKNVSLSVEIMFFNVEKGILGWSSNYTCYVFWEAHNVFVPNRQAVFSRWHFTHWDLLGTRQSRACAGCWCADLPTFQLLPRKNMSGLSSFMEPVFVHNFSPMIKLNQASYYRNHHLMLAIRSLGSNGGGALHFTITYIIVYIKVIIMFFFQTPAAVSWWHLLNLT